MRLLFLLTNAELSTNGNEHQNGAYVLLKDDENPNLGVYDKPLPCFGCGIGWFSSVSCNFLFFILPNSPFFFLLFISLTLFRSLLLGFVFPLMWYYATILYFCNYYQKDPRERAGLAASAIAVSVLLKV